MLTLYRSIMYFSYVFNIDVINVLKTRYTFCSTERGFLPHCSCVYCAELATDLAKISLGQHSI